MEAPIFRDPIYDGATDPGLTWNRQEQQWERNGLILDQPGSREDEGTIGLHTDVVVQGDEAYIFYFTHPDRLVHEAVERTYTGCRSSIQVVRLLVLDGKLTCERNESFELSLQHALD